MTNEETIKVLKELKNCKSECDFMCALYDSRESLCVQNIALDLAIKALEQQRWIPVSERLPSKDGFYIATCDGEICGEEQPFTGFAEFENRKWVDDEDDYQCVLAWMPLPKPYKAESENKG